MSANEAPPSYETAAKSSSRTRGSHEIPSDVRRSMEDAIRPLPKGWVKQWDPNTLHNFFVDTTANPPRSIWAHPLDDEQYLKQHPDEARALEQQAHAQASDAGSSSLHTSSGEGSSAPRRSSMIDPQTQAALHDESSEDETDHRSPGKSGANATPQQQPKGLKKLGRSVKDKLTHSTHEQRVAARAKKREQERIAYEKHQEIRSRMMTAARTGQPQLVGRDRTGRDIYAQPPPPGMYGGGATLGYTPYQTPDQYAYGPGAYAAPMGPYGRRPGYGYGGGMGLPLMGGLAGGMLLGGLMF